MSMLQWQIEENNKTATGAEEPLLTNSQKIRNSLQDKIKKRLEEQKEKEKEKQKTVDFEKRALAANIENSDDYAKTRIEYF